MESAISYRGSFFKKIFIYVLGIICLFVPVFVGVFFLVKGMLVSFVTGEIKKRGLEAEAVDISIVGNVSLEGARYTLKDGTVVTAKKIVGRPPVLWIGGKARFYDIEVKQEEVSVFAPEVLFRNLHLKNVNEEAKLSREIQLFERIFVAAIDSRDVEVRIAGKELVNVGKISLEDIAEGKIYRVKTEAVKLTDFPVEENAVSTVCMGEFLAENIDLATLYEFASKSALPDLAETGDVRGLGPVLKKVQLGDLDISYRDSSEKIHLAVGKYRMSGISLLSYRTSLYNQADGESLQKQGSSRYWDSIVFSDARFDDVVLEGDDMKAAISVIETKFTDWNQLVPHRAVTKVEGAVIDIVAPEEGGNGYARILSDMGYKRLELSGGIDVLRDSAEQALVVNEIRFAGQDIGTLELKGKLLNIGEEFFNGNLSESERNKLLEKGSFSDLSVKVTDSGLMNRVLDWESAQINVPKQELKENICDTVTGGLMLLSGGHPVGKKISDAVVSFVKNSGMVELHAVAREKKGVAMTEFFNAENLSDLFGKLDITAQHSIPLHK